MTQKEKIEMATIGHKNWPEMISQQKIKDAYQGIDTNAKHNFLAGVHFAEAELKTIATEFAEWREMKYHPVFNNPDKRYWYKHQSFDLPLTTAELFNKFMAERQV
jgi:hypothetical protein